MTRLEVLSSYINEKVIDVGCDQAILSKNLAKRGIYSVASDIRRNIIENAYNSTPDNLKKYIDFRVGNGITLKEDEDYPVVLAGMGTYRIISIIKEYNKPIKKIITISNNDHYLLRKTLVELGYKIDKEEIIKEKGIYYNLIIFIRGDAIYTEEELLVGINHQNIKILKEKNDYLINKYSNILKRTNNKELENIVNVLKNYNY